MKIVSNATPIISLCSIGQVDLLRKLFGKILIPKAVYSEIKAKNRFGYHEIDADFFEVREIQGKIYVGFLRNDLDQWKRKQYCLQRNQMRIF